LESITRSDTCWCDGEGAGLAQQLVDQRGLAMIDVRDDGDVAYGTLSGESDDD
jgi:hypothetical protein